MTHTSIHPLDYASNETFSNLLSPLHINILKEFIHRCADKICGRKGPSEEKFCSPCCWTKNQLQELGSRMEAFIIDCIVKSYDRRKVEELLHLNDVQITAMMSCLAMRGDELQNSILTQYQNGSSDILTGCDWKLKWVMGSSSLSSLQDTLLELDLTTVRNSSILSSESEELQKGRIRTELTRDNVNTLINVLEKALESP